MNRVYFIRHAESHANRLPVFNNAGRNDPLTETGALQAERTAEWLSAIKIQAIYSSPIQRAIETARILSQPAQKPIHILPELKEFNLGELEEQPKNQTNLNIHRRVLNAWLKGRLEMSFPNGESGMVFVERFSSAVEQMIAENEPGSLAVVCHGGHILFGLGMICAGGFHKLDWRIKVKNCSITIAELWVTDQKLNGRGIQWADASHLPQELVTPKL